MTTTPNEQHVGSSLDDFLESEGTLAEAEAVATKRVIAWQMAQEMQAKGITKTEMARQMHTSRAVVERLLDPQSPSVTLLTLERAARVLGRTLRVQLT
jgi:antitoxin HicB